MCLDVMHRTENTILGPMPSGKYGFGSRVDQSFDVLEEALSILLPRAPQGLKPTQYKIPHTISSGMYLKYYCYKKNVSIKLHGLIIFM